MNTCLNRELTRIKGLHGLRNNDWCSLQPVCRSNASGTWGLFDLLLPCTLRSAGARELDVSPFYRHIAPLEQKHICRPAGAMLVQRFIELMNTCLNRELTRIKGLHGLRNNDWCSLQPVCRSNASGTWGCLIRLCYAHCALLERGNWTYRPSIDISLLWSKSTYVAPLGLCWFRGSLS